MTGQPIWSSRQPILLGLICIVLLVAGFGIWSMTTTIAGAIVTSGQIEVEQNRQVVQHPDGGVVDEIFVTEAAMVKAGDILIRLDGTTLRSELAIVEGQFYEILARRARLEAERDAAATPVYPAPLRAVAQARPDVANQLDGQTRLFIARRETLAKQSEQLERRNGQILSQIDGVDAQTRALKTQLRLIEQELADVQSLLAKGLAQASRVLALEREQASLEGQLGELASTRAQAQGQMTQIDLEILRLAASRREEANTQLRDLGYRELELAERRRALGEQIQRLEIRAPVSGVVYSLQVTTPRAVLRAAEPVLYIVPQDRPLVIAARIASINVDEVHVGQPVTLRFSAFDSRTTPELNGQIAKVSADAFTDDRTQAQYYRTEISLDQGELAKLGDLELIPGMPVEAYIKTADRTPMAYLLKPFADYFNRAFRES